MTKEEIWEKLAEEVKLRGFSPLSYYTYKSNITTFLDWCNKPYEDLDDFHPHIHCIVPGGGLNKIPALCGRIIQLALAEEKEPMDEVPSAPGFD